MVGQLLCWFPVDFSHENLVRHQVGDEICLRRSWKGKLCAEVRPQCPARGWQHCPARLCRSLSLAWEHFQLQPGFSLIMDELVCVRSKPMGHM